jgi:hypothetical protein
MLSFLHALLLYLHILSVIVSLGPFFVMFPVMGLMKTADDAKLHSLIGVFRFAVRLTKHAGHVLVATGALLVWISGWRWSDFWIVATVTILFGALFFMARAFSPTLRKLAAPGHDRDALVRKLYRAVIIYMVLLLVMMWFMVAKPSWW